MVTKKKRKEDKNENKILTNEDRKLMKIKSDTRRKNGRILVDFNLYLSKVKEKNKKIFSKWQKRYFIFHMRRKSSKKLVIPMDTVVSGIVTICNFTLRKTKTIA